MSRFYVGRWFRIRHCLDPLINDQHLMYVLSGGSHLGPSGEVDVSSFQELVQ